MNKRAVMIASQIVMNRGPIREAMDPLLCSYTGNDASDDLVQIERDYYAAQKQFFGLVYRLVEPLLDAPLPDDKGMESLGRYYGFSPEEAILPPHMPQRHFLIHKSPRKRRGK
jgi:hypothetical protein